MIQELHSKIYEKLNYFYESNKIPHIIFHGASGSGKRTIVDNFINKIYQNDAKKIKSNVMIVNCAHGKGIKFIREELKFFAKTNIQSNNGVLFKTIVLLNADNLTIDAQSALRRCIELFSSNTRFFIIVDNKNKLLNPILSRFCEIYVHEAVIDSKIINLHQYKIQNVFDMKFAENQNSTWIAELMDTFLKSDKTHSIMVDFSTEIYEHGLSCIDLMKWIEKTTELSNIKKTEIYMHFDKIKSEYRCEKLLLLYLLNEITK